MPWTVPVAEFHEFVSGLETAASEPDRRARSDITLCLLLSG